MRKIETYSFGTVTLRNAFDPDTSLNGEGYVEVYNESGDLIGEIYGFGIDEVNEDMIEEIKFL